MPASDADKLRGLTARVNNVAGVEPLREDVQLCDEALVYSYTLTACLGDGALDTEEPLATWHLQDSEISVYQIQCELRADLPGLRLPPSSRLIVAPGVRVVLNISYGNCSS